MSRFYVSGKAIHCVELLQKRHWAWRMDMWFFAIIYGVWLPTIVPRLNIVDSFIVLCSLVVVHILVSMLTVWCVDFKCFVQYSKVNDINRADTCKVTPASFFGSNGVVPLHKLTGSYNSVDVEEIYFDFRKQRFIYSKEKNTFCKFPYPTKEKMGYYRKTSGYVTEAEVMASIQKWGWNVFEYPGYRLLKFMKERCMQLFFVVKVVSLKLCCSNECWYYGCFALTILIIFELTMTIRLSKNLSFLTRRKWDFLAQALMVYRCRKWVQLFGDELVPGDVVSVVRFVPADMLILAGSASVDEAILTGDPTPKLKVSIVGRGSDEKLSMRRDKTHILFGGTKILEHTPDVTNPVMRTPDGGCLAVVLRTGYGTSQGKLMVHRIPYFIERVNNDRWGSGIFVLFLVVFALIALVLKKGHEVLARSKYQLFQSCLLIIILAVPPELVIELSINLNKLLMNLEFGGIYCREPLQVQIAGKVDLCCFDKTGTLTSDDMEFSGVGGLTDSDALETDVLKLPTRTWQILVSCHALVSVNNKLVGSPLEKDSVKGMDSKYKSDKKSVSKNKCSGSDDAVRILKRHCFASHLKRMAVVVCVKEQFFAFVKGAPETIQDRLVHMPAFYVETYQKHTRQGSFVLALAYKALPVMTVREARSLERDAVESGLTFAGFAVFNSPIRRDSATVLSELKKSSHDLVMITGDQALTACHVAGEVNIVSKPALILSDAKNSEGYQWLSPDESFIIKYRENEVEALSEAYDLCIGGNCIEMLQQTSGIHKVIPYVKVFARMAPEQKELIMATFKSMGRVTLMCGDGTNDVGALKQAHIGVGLPIARSLPVARNGYDLLKSRDYSEFDSSISNQALIAARTFEFGDASWTSLFMAKYATISSTIDIIRQGRSILVTTRQMLKISFLRTACILSVMYLDGIKQSNIQATISGVSATALFLFTSRARPHGTLSAERPHPNNLCTYAFLSLLGQFGVHILFLISCVKEGEKYMPDKCIEQQKDLDFHPNLVSTVTYMANVMILLATYTVNYMGHPFNQSISENKPFLYTLVSTFGFLIVITSDLFRDLNDWLKLVPLPTALRDKLMLWAFLMSLCCYLWERLLRWAFPGKMPAWRLQPRRGEPID